MEFPGTYDTQTMSAWGRPPGQSSQWRAGGGAGGRSFRSQKFSIEKSKPLSQQLFLQSFDQLCCQNEGKQVLWRFQSSVVNFGVKRPDFESHFLPLFEICDLEPVTQFSSYLNLNFGVLICETGGSGVSEGSCRPLQTIECCTRLPARIVVHCSFSDMMALQAAESTRIEMPIHICPWFDGSVLNPSHLDSSSCYHFLWSMEECP